MGRMRRMGRMGLIRPIRPIRPMNCPPPRHRDSGPARLAGPTDGQRTEDDTVISVVIPVYNEADSLPTLHAELADVAKREGLDLEIVFVDDGSTDTSWRVIKELSHQHANVHGVRFRRNFGKAAALSAGFRAAKGALILTLDADLQDDP